MTDAVLTNGGKTGYPPGLLQDDCRKLSKWLALRMNARQEVREVCRLIAQEKTMNDKTEQAVTDALRCTAAGGHAEIIKVPGYPLMVRAVDYNTLRDQLAEAQGDAERYSWLRMNRLWLKANLPTIAAPDFDATIDNAIDAAKGGTDGKG